MSDTIKAGIVLDAWKLTIFERRLTKAGFTYEQHPGLTDDTITLTVQTDQKDKLLETVKAANTEAARVNKPS